MVVTDVSEQPIGPILGRVPIFKGNLGPISFSETSVTRDYMTLEVGNHRLCLNICKHAL